MNDHSGEDQLSRSDRRGFLKQVGLGAAIGLAGGASTQAQEAKSGSGEPPAHPRRNPIGVSTYSFWQFRNHRLGILGLHRQGRGHGVRRRGSPPHPDGRRVERRPSRRSSGRLTRSDWP